VHKKRRLGWCDDGIPRGAALEPTNTLAHANLGIALERKGNLQGALEEYRAAYMLDPKNATYKQNYERLLQPSSQLGEATPTDISGEWKSLTSASIFKMRLEDGHAYVELLLSDEQRAAGAFQLCDLKMEDGRYRGVCRVALPLSWSNAFGQQHKVCILQIQRLITKYTATRVEGSFEEMAQTGKWSFNDYKECGRRIKHEWEDFVWIRPN
jgi:tetratricopeptide (TPR) repeat protein